MPAFFDDFALGDARQFHPADLDLPTRGRYAHKGPLMRAAKGHTHHNLVPFGDHFLYLKTNIGKSCFELHHRMFGGVWAAFTSVTGKSMSAEVRSDDFVSDTEITLIEHFLEETPY